MGGRAVCLLVGLLMVCGFCPPSGVSNRIPRGFDAANVLLRVALAAGYLWTQLLTPSTIQELTTKTYEIILYLMRVVLVIHHLVALALSPSFGRTISLISHLRLRSCVSLLPGIFYSSLIMLFPFIWRNPFASINEFPIIFLYLSLSGCILVISLQTVLIEIFLQKEQRFHKKVFNYNLTLLAASEFQQAIGKRASSPD